MPRSKSQLPEIALATIRRYCEAKVPTQYRDEMRVECDTRGKNVTIYECRPP